LGTTCEYSESDRRQQRGPMSTSIHLEGVHSLAAKVTNSASALPNFARRKSRVC
jgi:hypothetical protein